MQSAVHNSIGPTSIGPTSFAPVTASYAPSGSGALSYNTGSHSTGPVALNVDEDMPAVHRGRRVRPERWLLAAAGVIAVALIGFNNKDLFSSSVATAEKQASAAALIARPYEAPAEKASGAREATTAQAAVKSAPVDDGDAPIGSLKGENAEEESGEAPSAADEAVTKPGAFNSKDSASKDSASKDKDSLRGGMAKAFAKGAPATKGMKAEKPTKASKAAKAKLARKASASRATKGKKGVPRAASAFDPLNGSLP
jgi:hypothetical protein